MNFHDIKGYEGLYQINKLGEIYSINRKIKLKPRLSSWGYLSVSLRKDDKYHTELIHRLLAQTFIENPENKQQVNHIDGVKTNNHVNNLEWCTPSENHQHKQDYELQTKNGNQKLVELTNIKTGEKELFVSMNNVSRFFNFKPTWVQSRIKRFGNPFKYDGYVIEVINQ